MKPKYLVKYEETKETMVQTCELQLLDVNALNIRIGIGVLGAAVLCIMIVQGNFLDLPFMDQLLFLVKFCAGWLGVFVVGEIFANTIGKKLQRTSAYGHADELYEERSSKRKGTLVVEMQFYDDKFVNDTKTKKAPFGYDKVIKLLESEDAIGIVIRSDYGPAGIFGFPKNSVEDGKLEELKAFLLEKCVRVKKGFKQL